MHKTILLLFATLSVASASVFMPYSAQSKTVSRNPFSKAQNTANRDLRLALKNTRDTGNVAMAIPGYGVAEQVFVGGFSNFLSIYNLIITARILLSWFPQAQGVGALQPIYAITDPFLNLFRGLIPPLFGLDFSPILAFFLLNVVTNATAAIGAELPTQSLPVFRQGHQNNPLRNYLHRKKTLTGSKDVSMNY